MIRIDIDDPAVLGRIRDAIESDLWVKNRDAIAHARELVLEKYQLFPYITDLIRKDEAKKRTKETTKSLITIPGEKLEGYSIITKMKRKMRSALRKIGK